MILRIPRVPGLPGGGGLNLLLLAGGVYFAAEHERGRHTQPHVACPICWLNRIAPPPPDAASGASPPPPESPQQD
jgi:hypothetical protein